METDLKRLMKDGVDVTDLYTKVSEIVELSHQSAILAKQIDEKESQIKELLNSTIKEGQTLKVDLMNGTQLVLDVVGNMWLEEK